VAKVEMTTANKSARPLPATHFPPVNSSEFESRTGCGLIQKHYDMVEIDRVTSPRFGYGLF